MWNLIKEVEKYIIIGIVSFCVSEAAFSQNCFDADFESGSVGGYTTFYGSIDASGVLTFPNMGVDPNQHKIMSVADGVDPIANMYCIVNKNLPVAGQGAGRYSLRLGDADNGAKTSKVVLSFEVTPNVSFFLLKYAVVLEDPMHQDYEQPRFEMYIKDQFGTILDCGEYSVRAAENIPGFESCGTWRVRPWTTAGFELQSYIGQTINIEILTTDCSKGGHGGYAYIDANCKPLELILDSYCPDSLFARYYVSEGFDSYEWNTGDSSNIIEIENAMAGDEYSVTVTSSTGCTLVLKDTLPPQPEIEDLEFSFFDGPDTIDVCLGEPIDYQPSGTNIGVVNALELGYSGESFQFFANESRKIHFVTKDNFGCLYDTMQLVVNLYEIEVDVEKTASCVGNSNGSITIIYEDDYILSTSLDNGPFIDTLYYENLQVGNHSIMIKNTVGCNIELVVFIVEEALPNLSQIDIMPATCGLDNGIVSISDFDPDIEYSFDGSAFGIDQTWLNVAGGTYNLLYRNSSGCIATEIIQVDSYLAPDLDAMATDSVYCDYPNGVISCSTTGGLSPFTYSIDGSVFNSNPIFEDVYAGEYLITVRDYSGCVDTFSVSLTAVPYVSIMDVESSPAYCDEDNGLIDIHLDNDHISYLLYLNDEVQSDLLLNDLPYGDYTITIEDINGCTDQQSITVEEVKPPKMESIEYIERECGDAAISAVISAKSYTEGVFYSVNGSQLQSGDEVVLVSGENIVYIVDDLGCESETMIPLPEVEKWSFANIFSPNDDGTNDLFCFQNIDSAKKVEFFYIYDRWGNKVFDQQNKNIDDSGLCWDGKYKSKKVAMGVYVYNIRVRLQDGRLLCMTGDVTVI